MRTLLITIALVGFGCSDDNKTAVDAAPQIDAPLPAATLDCPSYCTNIATACTGANNQYASNALCMATCAKFPVGALADTMGNTLGCRIYHTSNVTKTAMPDVHCSHAGPGGGKVAVIATGGTPDTHCSDACTNFCALEVAACGTIAAGGANAQYQDLAACMTACAGFDRATAYSATTTSGNNLACRLYHVTAAASDPATHCKHTQATATAPCI